MACRLLQLLSYSMSDHLHYLPLFPPSPPSPPLFRWMQVRCGAEPPRRLAWYDPSPDAALDKMLRAACRSEHFGLAFPFACTRTVSPPPLSQDPALARLFDPPPPLPPPAPSSPPCADLAVAPDDDYLLCEPGGLPMALSSSLPTGQTFEVVRSIKRAGVDEIARATAAGEPVKGADALVIVDPVSTGAVVAYQAVHRMGLQIICVWSESIPDELKGFVAKGMAVPYAGMITHTAGDLPKTVAAIRAVGIPLVGCIVGCETGVSLGDYLSEALKLPTNGTLKTGLRRNKYAQTEAVRAAGLEACFQMQADSMDGVEAFINAWCPSPYRAVVKPVEGAGSDGVSIVDSPDGVRRAFRALEGTKNVLGLTNYSVLLQEYLKGAPPARHQRAARSRMRPQ